MVRPLTDREIALVGRGSRLVFASAVVAIVVLPAVSVNLILPSVVVNIPADVTIDRVIAAIAWRKQVDSSAAVNAINTAQQIRVRDDTPGTYRNAITLADNSLETASSATEGGLMLLGDSDISAEVDGDDTYEFQWQDAEVDGASLTLHDVQTYIIVEYT
jgi:hypothetical protein